MGLEFTSDDFLAVIDEMTFEELKDSCDELGATLAPYHYPSALLPTHRAPAQEIPGSQLLCGVKAVTPPLFPSLLFSLSL